MTKNNLDFLKGNHKTKLIIIIILLIICAIWYFKGVNLHNMTSWDGAKNEISENIKPNTTEKKVLLGAMGALTAAGGYEAYQIWRDSKGNEVASTTPGAKPTKDWDCKDFKTQGEAQTFFINAGGPSNDTNRLDGNNDGTACQALPKK